MLLPEKNPSIRDITYQIDGGSVSHSKGGSFNFGFIPSGGMSKTIIVYLGVTGIVQIKNIKLFIKSTGNISFESCIFGVDSLDYIDKLFIPTSKFTGVNPTLNPNSSHCVPIQNRNSLTSKYVYLNMQLTNGQALFESAVTFGWIFDYVNDISKANLRQIQAPTL